MTIVVIKIGGSVLTGLDAYRRAAVSLRDRLSREPARYVAVVSAEYGQTDALWREAVSLDAEPGADALDLLWSTGELRSVALLTLAARAAGIAATGLNVHETGLTSADAGAPFSLNPIALRAALATHDVVVIPGFLATRAQQVVTLGRGGSDWSAVLLAIALGASRCELIKDVDGYFTADPAVDPLAARIDALDYRAALALADTGCPLVQRQAIAEAAEASLPLVIRSFTGGGTLVHAAGIRADVHPHVSPSLSVLTH